MKYDTLKACDRRFVCFFRKEERNMRAPDEPDSQDGEQRPMRGLSGKAGERLLETLPGLLRTRQPEAEKTGIVLEAANPDSVAPQMSEQLRSAAAVHETVEDGAAGRPIRKWGKQPVQAAGILGPRLLRRPSPCAITKRPPSDLHGGA